MRPAAGLLFIAWCAAVWASFVVVAASDPGTVDGPREPRPHDEEPAAAPPAANPPAATGAPLAGPSPAAAAAAPVPAPRSAVAILAPAAAAAAQVGYCRVCQHRRPARSRHCFQCKKCVRRFDHHCPYMGVCVGEDNHRQFVVAVTLHAAACLHGIHLFAGAVHRTGDMMTWLPANMAPLLACALAVVGGAVFSALAALHLFLAASGRTTFETMGDTGLWYLPAPAAGGGRAPRFPFDRGVARNLAAFWRGGRTDWDARLARVLAVAPADGEPAAPSAAPAPPAAVAVGGTDGIGGIDGDTVEGLLAADAPDAARRPLLPR